MLLLQFSRPGASSTLCDETGLPAFLHFRGDEHDVAEQVTSDFVDICKRNLEKFRGGGVVHSFTGSFEQAQVFADMGFYIDINGCSLKTEENLNVLRSLPLDRILLEMDAPWCEIKRTHASHSLVKIRWPSNKKERFVEGETVKERSETCHIVQVAEFVAGVKNVSVAQVASQT